MKQGITINDILALADIELKVRYTNVGSFIQSIKYDNSLKMTQEEIDLVERALIEKVIVNNLDRTEIMDLIIEHAYDLKMSADNETYSTYDELLGTVNARNLYEVLRDIINS